MLSKFDVSKMRDAVHLGPEPLFCPPNPNPIPTGCPDWDDEEEEDEDEEDENK